MKKVLSLLICILLIAVSFVPAFAAKDNLLVDGADLLTPDEETKINALLCEASDELQFDIVLVTTDSLGGKSSMDFADDYYDYNGYGQGDSNDGCLLVVSMSEREYWLSTTGYGITALTDYGISIINSEVQSYLSDGDYYSAFYTYADRVREFVSSARQGNIIDVNNSNGYESDYYYSGYESAGEKTFSNIAVSLIVGLIISLIVVLSVKKSYKAIQFQRSAANYLDDGSFNLSQSYEHFLYSHVSRVKIQTESHSSSGGSSVHTSSSGTSHGGGGGHF